MIVLYSKEEKTKPIVAECPVCHRKQSVKAKACPCGVNLDNEKKNKKVCYHIIYRRDGKQIWRSLSSFKDVDPCSVEDARTVEGQFRTCRKEKRFEVFDIKPGADMTSNALTEWYLALASEKEKKSYDIIAFNLASFNQEFGHHLLSSIKPTDLEGNQVLGRKEGYADSYIDQQIGRARTAVEKAFGDELIDGEAVRTFDRVKRLVKRNQLTKKASNARERILTQDEYQTLMLFLPGHIKLAFAMALYTGMRKGEILNLTWDKVDLEARLIELKAADTKDNEAKTITIGEQLYKMLIKNRKPDGYVIQFRGKPVKDIRTAIRNACEEAHIPYGQRVKNGITFHDLRHTFNTMMRKAEVDKNVTMTITGHSTEEMNRHYNTVDTEDMRLAIRQYENMLQSRSVH